MNSEILRILTQLFKDAIESIFIRTGNRDIFIWVNKISNNLKTDHLQDVIDGFVVFISEYALLNLLWCKRFKTM